MKLIDNVNIIIDDISKKCQALNNKYDPKKQHYNVGDIVYYLNYNGKITPAVIDEVQNFQHSTGPGGLIYYWITPKNCKLTILNQFKFYFYTYIIPWRPSYKIPNGFPGHAVLPGDDIFSNEEDAIESLFLHNLKYDLQQYVTILDKNNNTSLCE